MDNDETGIAHAHELSRRLDEHPSLHGQVIKEFFAERSQSGDHTGAAYALVFQKINLEKRNMTWEYVSPLLKLMIVTGFILALVFGLLGVWLVYLGATGNSEIGIFGQSIKSSSVGIVAIFLGAIIFILTGRSVLRTLRHTTEHKPH